MSKPFNPFGNAPYSKGSVPPRGGSEDANRPGTIEYSIRELWRSGYVPFGLREEYNTIREHLNKSEVNTACEMLLKRGKEFEKQEQIKIANRWYKAGGDVLLAAGQKPESTQYYLLWHTNSKNRGDENDRKKAEKSINRAYPVNAEIALGIEGRPPRDPAGAKRHFGAGTNFVREGKMEEALEEFRQAAALDFRHHGALFAYALCLMRINYEKGISPPGGVEPVKVIGPPHEALMAMDAAVYDKAESNFMPETWDPFTRELAEKQKEAVWASCDENSQVSSPWIMLGLMSEYLVNQEAALECLEKARANIRPGPLVGIMIRALSHLEKKEETPPSPPPPQAEEEPFYSASNLYCHIFAGLVEIAIVLALMTFFKGFGGMMRSLRHGVLFRDFMMLLSYRFLLVFILRSKFLSWVPLYIVPYSLGFIFLWAMLGRVAFLGVVALLALDIIKTTTNLKNATGISFDKRALPTILGGQCQAFVGVPFHGAMIAAYVVLLILPF